MYAFNSSTKEAEVSRSLILRPFWSTKQILGQPGLQRETLKQTPVPSPHKRKKRNFNFSLLAYLPLLLFTVNKMLFGYTKDEGNRPLLVNLLAESIFGFLK